MKLEIDDKKIEDILRLEISYRLSGIEKKKHFDNKIESILKLKIDEYLKSNNFEDIVKNIILKIKP